VKDITDLMLEYAEARRSLWNNFFRRRAIGPHQADVVEDFQEIDRIMLSTVVRRSLGMDFPMDTFFVGESSLDCIEIVLRQHVSHAAALVTEEAGGFGNKRWRGGLELSATSPMRIEFVEFFDWDQLGFITSSLCHGRIVELPGHDELVGRDLLIEVHLINFCLRTWKSN